MPPDITEENIQIAGAPENLMMALQTSLVRWSPHRKQIRNGRCYCTLYGDMVARWRSRGPGEDPVYAICRWLNRDRESFLARYSKNLHPPNCARIRGIPRPPYEVLNPILEAYVERYESPPKIAQENGFPLDLVTDCPAVERSSINSQQAAPVLKVTYKVVWNGTQVPSCRQVQFRSIAGPVACPGGQLSKPPNLRRVAHMAHDHDNESTA